MRISIFPKVKNIPKNSGEKRKLSALCVDPVVVDIKDSLDLIEYISQFAWSPSIFNGNRCNNNFLSTDFMVLDIDNGLTIEEAELRCDELGVDYIIGITTSHTKDHHKFRLIFPLVKTITDKPTFDATWNYLQEKFPELDDQCSDYARFFFQCRNEGTYMEDSELLAPVEVKKFEFSKIAKQSLVSTDEFKDKKLLEVLYDKIPKNIPESVDFFLKMAYTGLDGMWNNSLNACVFTLSLQGIDLERIEYVIKEVAPESLDSNDLYCINRAFKNGQEKREDNARNNGIHG